VINFSYILIFALPLALLLSRLIGLEGIWIGIVSGNLLSSVLGAIWAAITSRRLDAPSEEPLSAAQPRR